MFRKTSLKRNFKFVLLALMTIFAVDFLLTATEGLPKSIPSSVRSLAFSRNGSAPNCPSVRLSSKVLPNIALVSYPGSGNTWTRHLIQQLTGIATGSVYIDEALRLNGFPGESLSNGSVVAVKTHEYYEGKRYTRAILLIRNPYEAFLSLFKLIKSNHTGELTVDKYGKDWDEFAFKEIDHYHKLLASWMKHRDVLLIFYDALKQNLTQELVKIKAFLGESDIAGDIRCAMINSAGTFHRKKIGLTLDFFYSKKQIKSVNMFIDQMRKMLEDRFGKITVDMDAWKL
ncbi:WSCD family member AGAP003962-like [Haliotis rubra]|uniref:WSCD family member AGAP003962-like n=1 Tax=Haliotis rubra TaxID=36100 RepID=UPI001EE580CE|nr:WSCD family member AGAP003962-like [Haliotis rubra]